ncbi:MAG: tolC4 [Herminiimonas sp.]|nr:tolC4 [Herminiimonas sp.]
MKFPIRRIMLVSVTALLLTSCASFSGIETSAPVRAPADFASAASLPEQDGPWPDHSWPAAIGGAPLQALIDEAFAGNPGLQVAAARVAAARALADTARAAGSPGATAGFNSTYQRFTENGLVPPQRAGQYVSDNRLTLDFSYDFDFWGRHSAELHAALSQGKAAEAEQHASRLALSTSIARAWIQLARQHAQLDLVEQQLLVRRKIDRLTQLRIKAGLDTQSDEEQARQQQAVLRAEQAQWQESIALARNQLAALMGQGPDRGMRIARPELPRETALRLPNEVPLTLLGRRPDIVAARWRAEAAQGDIDAAKAQFYPNVNLIAFAGFSSLGLTNLLQFGSRVAGIGPAIRLPVFEAGALRAQLKGKVAAYDSAVGSYNQALTDALRDVADQLQSLRGAQIQAEHQRDAAQAAANSHRLAQHRERVGTINMLPVLATEMTWLMQRKAELDSQARRADLRIGLIKALGGGFDAAAAGLEPGSAASNNSTQSKHAS